MATTTTEVNRHRWPWVLFVAVVMGCAADSPVQQSLVQRSRPSTDPWSVTAWGQRFEVFPEIDTLVAGQIAMAHTHVTRLVDFAPVAQAKVEIVLVGSSGEQVFTAEQPDRPGLFNIEVVPTTPGEADLLFRIHDAEGTEEVRGGRVRIGTAEAHGGLLRAPAPRGGTDGGEPLDFNKEQQWKSSFSTAWVRNGSLARSVSGLATFRPPAGGERAVTAPIAGVVQPSAGSRSWPFVGLGVTRGTPLLRILPLVAPERRHQALDAELAILASELETARARHARLERLLLLEATSAREVETSKILISTLEARKRAATLDHDVAHEAGGVLDGTAQGMVLKAPFSGQIAEVTATPGATIAAGATLARLVQTDPVWVAVALPPVDARQIAETGIRGLVLEDPEGGVARIEEGLSFIAVAPEVSARTGTVTVLLEMPGSARFALGSTVSAQLLSAEDETGIVIPASALVDDGGVPVVYLQLAGERFVRQEITVRARQGDRVLVDRLVPGQRLVARGGDAIRRSSMMNSGDTHGHVH